MKKVLILLFALVISLLTITSCKYFPLENGSTHEHDFILSETQDSTCSRKGTNLYTCSCGETKTEDHEDYAEHILFLGGQIFPSCTEVGEKNYFCRNCTYTAVEAIPATGHSIGASVEVSRLIPCKNKNCSYAVFPECDGEYKNVIVYNFTDEDIARFDSIYAELEAIISSAEAYDATLHAYARDTDLYKQYLAMKSKHDELYDNLKQSIDLLDIQSQGNEMLYLSFLRDLMSEKGFVLCENYKLLNMLDTIMSSLAVSTFEQAVYAGTYSGTYSDEIMSDGRISRDEYDLLYMSILEDFGVAEYQMAEYWRYATINAPCYYASYAVSALSALQIYAVALEYGFDVAKDAYLKLFTYTDDSLDMSTSDILVHAGLMDFTNEGLYAELALVYTEKIK